MKTKITLFFSLLLSISISAQNAFFPTQAGIVQKYVQKNDKQKVQGYSRQTIKNVEGSGSNMTVSYLFELLDKEQKPSNPPVEMPCKMMIKNNVAILEMSEMFAATQGMQNSEDIKVEITGMPMELPNTLQAGQTLKDANVTMTTDMGIMKLSTNIVMTDGKCLAIEDITVPAGTFKCHKITQTCTTKVMKKEIVSKTISWYALGVGTVKTESYDSKDKLQSSTELVEFVKP